MAFKNTNLGLLAYSTDFILKRARTLARLLSQSSATSFTPGNGYRYDIFTTPGSFTVHTSGYMDVMLVGGGGGGGTGGPGSSAKGGGGGAGGVRIIYNQLFAVGPYTVTIGAGGNGGGFDVPTLPPSVSGEDGESSYITGPGSFGPSPLSSPGGGGGGVGLAPSMTPAPHYYGQPGGSGGGAGGYKFYNFEGSGTTGFGYPGGYGDSPAGSSSYTGGGGGGASESGGTFPNSRGGSGISAFSNDTGIPPSYGTPGPGDGRYFGGGGDGGGPPVYTTRPVGGGGAASSPDSLSTGLTNTGGGGAGGNVNGYSGGPGIVIIRSYVSF
jgi:hypothetical protein